MSCLAVLNDPIEMSLAGHVLKVRRIPVLKLLALAEAHVLERDRAAMRANLELVPEGDRLRFVDDHMDKFSGEQLADKARELLSSGRIPDELICQILFTSVIKDQPDVTVDEIRCVFDDASREELIEAIGTVTAFKKKVSPAVSG